MSNGICVNPTCPVAAAKTRLERYPGPGEFCPECGDELQPAPSDAPFGGLSPFEALQRFDAVDATAAPAAPPAPRRNARLAVISGGLAAIAIAGAVAYSGSAIGKPAATGSIHVCRTSMTAHVARELIRAYAARGGDAAARFDNGSSGLCDVRFAGATALPANAQLALDGLVVVVNPQNPLTHLSRAQVAQVFRGDLRDWSRLGGSAGPIEAMLPVDGSDEATVATRTIMLESRYGARVIRLATSADVVRAVAAANGRRAIGIVAFSGAVPAKVLAIGALPPPSPLSIGDGRYPLTLPLGMVVEHDVPGAQAFAAFVHSDDGRAVMSRANLVAKGDS